MATLDIYNWSSRGSLILAQAPDLSNAVFETVTFDDSLAVQSAVFIGDMIMIKPSTDCFILVGDNPTADANDIPLLSADGWQKFVVEPGQRLSVIAPAE